MALASWHRFAFTSAGAAALMISLTSLDTRAGANDPLALPLLTESGLSYAGGFRVPPDPLNGNEFTYGGSPIAFNPINDSLFVGSIDGKVAEISIPSPVNSTDAKAMPAAAYLQSAFVDPTEGHWRDMSPSEITLYGLMVHQNRLIGAASIYYDANNNQRVTHFSRSLSLTQPSFSGWSRVWEHERSGLVSGWMAAVPTEWQPHLGGPAITGQCCIPIISRTSYGPAAFAFDPAQIGTPNVPAQPLVYYDANHPNLGRWEDQNETFGMSTRIGGVAIIVGTRTAIFVGSNGLGPACYGDGSADRKAADASLTDEICYDPTDSNKGTHAYPYRYQIWAYDLRDFAAVRAGGMPPWDVRPYAIWPLTFPTTEPQWRIGGVTFDAQRQRLFISERNANRGEFTAAPVIHMFTTPVVAAR
jgi:hypothetical protein